MPQALPITVRVSDPDGILDAIATLEDIRDIATYRALALRGKIAAERMPKAMAEREPGQDGPWPLVGGPMSGAYVPLREAYRSIQLPDAPDGEYVRSRSVDGRVEFLWIDRDDPTR
jgi:hypothetical protein